MIAGFSEKVLSAAAIYVSIIHILRFRSSYDDHYHHQITEMNQYQPISTPATWQDLVTNTGV